MPETPLTALKRMSPQAKAALWEKGINTLEAAAALTDEQLQEIKGMGPSSVEHIRRWQRGEAEPSKPATIAEREAMRRQVYTVELANGATPEEAKEKADRAVAVYYEEATDG